MLEAMKQMVEALEFVNKSDDDGDFMNSECSARVEDAIETGLKAIKELESQEPVAWMHIMDNTEGIKANGAGIVSITQKRKHPFGKAGIDFSKSYPVTSTPLYTHPPQRTEQGPMAPTGVKGYAMALNEVALKLRKRYEHDLLSTPLWAEFEKARNKLARSIATPPSQPAQRKPLTDKQIEACLHHVDEDGIGLFAFARAIEAAHGIKE